jgi:hypothetical protein
MALAVVESRTSRDAGGVQWVTVVLVDRADVYIDLTMLALV